MTATILPFASRQKDKQPPTRSPDFVFSGWLDAANEVDWVCLQGDCPSGEDAQHRVNTLMLLDGVWTYARWSDHAAEKPVDRIITLHAVDEGGWHTFIWDRELITNTNWRHAIWALRQGFRAFKFFANVAWRAL